MKRTVLVGILLLAVAVGFCYAEVGVGVSAGYPLAIALEYDLGFEPEILFAGAAVRWKPSLFLLDLGVSTMLGGGIMFGFLDIEICFDVGFLRFGLAGGVDFLRFADMGWGSYTAGGLNGKLNLDIKVGKITVGVSGTVPIDLLLQALTGGEVEDDTRLLVMQSSVNVLYWIGDSARSKLR